MSIGKSVYSLCPVSRFQIFVCFLVVGFTVHASNIDLSDSELEIQRANYQKAKAALARNRLSEYEELKATLDSYPLIVYLHYRESLRNIGFLKPEEATAIREKLRGSYLYDEFHKKWLEVQIKRNRWAIYAEYFEPTDDVVSNCHYLRALYRTGEKEKAMERVPEYWVVGISQPDECDPIFDVWLNEGYLTSDLLWKRIMLAVQQDSKILARYLLRFFSANERPLADLLLKVENKPTIVQNPHQFPNTTRGREVLTYGLFKFAQSESVEAWSLWEEYQTLFDFDEVSFNATSSALAFWATRDGELINEINPNYSEATKLRIADTAISQREWSLALLWLDACSLETKEDYKWKFWFAVASRRVGNLETTDLLKELALERTYYGFLAADHLDLPKQLNEHTWTDFERQQSIHRRDPRLLRILELYEIGESNSAKEEWSWLIPQLEPSAKRWLAFTVGGFKHPHHAIEIAYRSGASDLVTTRFPMPNRKQYERHTAKINVALPVLLAITRQESAFNPTAISPVGARGLMQLMPGTARRTARDIRVPIPSVQEILYPPVNIQIGSYHFRELLDEFDNHTILALAAYNAGSTRVHRWLKEQDAEGMDTRIWIETIPFHETRSYVKNVLAYIQVYSMLLDEPVPMFADHEKQIP